MSRETRLLLRTAVGLKTRTASGMATASQRSGRRHEASLALPMKPMKDRRSEKADSGYQAPGCHRYDEPHLVEPYTAPRLASGKKPSPDVKETSDQKPLSDRGHTPSSAKRDLGVNPMAQRRQGKQGDESGQIEGEEQNVCGRANVLLFLSRETYGARRVPPSLARRKRESAEPSDRRTSTAIRRKFGGRLAGVDERLSVLDFSLQVFQAIAGPEQQ